MLRDSHICPSFFHINVSVFRLQSDSGVHLSLSNFCKFFAEFPIKSHPSFSYFLFTFSSFFFFFFFSDSLFQKGQSIHCFHEDLGFLPLRQLQIWTFPPRISDFRCSWFNALSNGVVVHLGCFGWSMLVCCPFLWSRIILILFCGWEIQFGYDEYGDS